ncbi:MAG: IS701 family transposase [Rhizobiales bacterium]|nr:IS701 family transposase [Hyphomicrobiales bacterium]
MGLHEARDIESRFARYVERLVSVIGHADRAGPLRDYCLGLVMPGERKSVEPMAAITAPGRTAAQHQSLLHFVGEGGWSDEEVLGQVREMVLPQIERHGPIEAWIIDDTSIPKQGRHSVGVSHQYCGQLGKQANCQVAVTLSLANHAASLPVAYRLYLPKAWAEDDVRRRKAKVPENIEFKTKPEIALEQIRWACEIGLSGDMVLVDAGYGHDGKLRASITELGKRYVAGIQPQTLVWKPGVRPGRPPKKGRRDAPDTISVKDLALGLGARKWHTIRWREGTNGWLSSRFARVRVCVASSHTRPHKPAKEWLLIEWPEGDDAPTKYWLSTLPRNITRRDLVDAAKLRWRIERDYEELKQEVGLGHYEGRGWRGFHHHATLCIAAYGFLVSERETIPPSGPRSAGLFPQPAIPDSYRPRGSALAA